MIIAQSSLLLVVASISTSLAGCGGLGEADPLDPLTSPNLRVMQFNIQSARKGIDKVATVIRDAAPDVVALQEVDRFTSRGKGMDEIAELSARTGMPHSVFFKTIDVYGGEFGLAILSRHPISEPEQLPLPVDGAEARLAARALVTTPAGAFRVYVTHLSNLPIRAGLRQRQAKAILKWMELDSAPRLLMGDLNDGLGSRAVNALARVYRDVFSAVGEGRAETYPMPLLIPDARLDWIFASDRLIPHKARVIRRVASDHFPMVAELGLLPAVPEQPAVAEGPPVASEPQAPLAEVPLL